VSPVTVSSLSAVALAAIFDPERLAQATDPAAPTANLAGFLGFTALVLTGFLVLARLSQGVVDDGEETGTGSDGLRVSAGPAPAETEPHPDETASETGREPATPGRSGPAGASDAESAAPDDEPASPNDGEPTTSEYTAPPGLHRVDSGESATSGTVANDSPEAGTGTGAPSRNSHREATAQGTERAEPASIPPAALLANVALTQGLFGGILAAAAWFFQVPGTALGLTGGRVTGLAAVGVGIAFGVTLWVGNEAASALADAAGAGYDEGLRRMLAPSGARGWVILLGGVLPVIALVEEFLFRAAAVGAAGAAIGATGPTAAGAWALAAVSSLAFALGHGAQGRVGVVVTGMLGFVLAAGFVLSGSFLVVVVAHYVVNALEFLVHEWVGLPDPVWS